MTPENMASGGLVSALILGVYYLGKLFFDSRKDKVAEKTSAVTDVATANTVLAGTVNSLQTENTRLRDRVNSLEDDLTERDAHIDRLQDEIQKLQKDLQRIANELSGLRSSEGKVTK